MEETSSHVPQIEVAYELVFHTPNHLIYLTLILGIFLTSFQ